MKKILVLLTLAVALLGTACNESKPVLNPQSAANDFFQKIAECRFQVAYESTAFAFRAQTDFPAFQATAKELGLSNGTISCNWLSEEQKAQTVELSGELISASGVKIPVHLTLVQERKAWRVFAFRTPAEKGKKQEDRFSLVGKGNGFTSSANRVIPSRENLQSLTLRNLLLFNSAIQQGNFEAFYNNVSLAWQNQLTKTQLRNAFQGFIDSKMDITEALKMQPVFDGSPEIDPDGVMTVNGHFETKPNVIVFSLRFTFEFPYWKLYGIRVQIRG